MTVKKASDGAIFEDFADSSAEQRRDRKDRQSVEFGLFWDRQGVGYNDLGDA